MKTSIPPIPLSFDRGYSGKYLVRVLHPNGAVEEPFGPELRPNLILNSGLDLLFTSQTTGVGTNQGGHWGGWWPMHQYVRAGGGTTAPAATQTALVSPISNTGSASAETWTYDTVLGGATYTRTYTFAAEVGSPTYNELGLSDTTGGNLFSRVVLPSPLTLVAGQQLQVVYAVKISVPCMITPITVSLAAVGGFNISGSMKLIGTGAGIFKSDAYVGTLGNGLRANGFWSYSFGGMFYTDTAFPAVNTAFAGTICSATSSVDQGTLPAYVPGSFTRKIPITFPPNTPNALVSNINSIMMAATYHSTGVSPAAGLLLLLTSTQSKAVANTLSFNLNTTVSAV